MTLDNKFDDSTNSEPKSFDAVKFAEVYSTRLAEQKKIVSDLAFEHGRQESKLCAIQREYGEKYKIAIVKRFMATWEKSGKFPADDELTKVIFYLAGMEIKGMELDCDNSVPDTSLMEIDGVFCFKYLNVRLHSWMELKP